MNNQLEGLLNQITDLHSKWQSAENLIKDIQKELENIPGVTILMKIQNLKKAVKFTQEELQKRVCGHITGYLTVPAETGLASLPMWLIMSCDLIITEDGKILKNRLGQTGTIS